MEKMAKQSFPMPKKPCLDVKQRILRLRQQFVLMLKRQNESKQEIRNIVLPEGSQDHQEEV